jgi:hypothetical protein
VPSLGRLMARTLHPRREWADSDRALYSPHPSHPSRPSQGGGGALRAADGPAAARPAAVFSLFRPMKEPCASMLVAWYLFEASHRTSTPTGQQQLGPCWVFRAVAQGGIDRPPRAPCRAGGEPAAAASRPGGSTGPGRARWAEPGPARSCLVVPGRVGPIRVETGPAGPGRARLGRKGLALRRQPHARRGRAGRPVWECHVT